MIGLSGQPNIQLRQLDGRCEWQERSSKHSDRQSRMSGRPSRHNDNLSEQPDTLSREPSIQKYYIKTDCPDSKTEGPNRQQTFWTSADSPEIQTDYVDRVTSHFP